MVLRPIPTKREEEGSLFESKILVKSPKPRNKVITMSRNYDTKLLGEIIKGNYVLVYYGAENVGIMGILAYPKMVCFEIFFINKWSMYIVQCSLYLLHNKQ